MVVSSFALLFYNFLLSYFLFHFSYVSLVGDGKTNNFILVICVMFPLFHTAAEYLIKISA